MKKLLAYLILLSFITAPAMAWPWENWNKKPFEKKQEQLQPTPKPTINEGKQLTGQLIITLNEAKEENARLRESLVKIGKDLETAKLETQVVQKKADDLREWGTAQYTRAENLQQKLDAAIARYHRLKGIAAAIAAAIGILIGLQFMNLAPPPYNFLVPLGSAALFAGLVWTYF